MQVHVVRFWLIVIMTCAVSCPTLESMLARQGSISSTDPADGFLKSFLQAYVREAGHDGDKTTRYSFAYFDLNGDGQAEAIVYLMGRWWCGTGGCPTLILARDSSSYRLVSRILTTRPPIRVLNSSSYGWRSISVYVSGGGIVRGYEAELEFDGRSYPVSPANPPARPLRDSSLGQVLIPRGAPGQLLYP